MLHVAAPEHQNLILTYLPVTIWARLSVTLSAAVFEYIAESSTPVGFQLAPSSLASKNPYTALAEHHKPTLAPINMVFILPISKVKYPQSPLAPITLLPVPVTVEKLPSVVLLKLVGLVVKVDAVGVIPRKVFAEIITAGAAGVPCV